MKIHFTGEEATYFNQLKKSFHNCKVVSIEDDLSVKVHFDFIFPRYHARKQHLFFSQDLNRLLEIQEKEITLYKQGEQLAGSATIKMEYLTPLTKLKT